LQEKVRLLAGVPLLYIHQKAPTLEAASAASLNKSDKISQEKYGSKNALNFFANSMYSCFRFLPEKQCGESVKEIKLKMLGPDPDLDKPIFRRKKIKGPNPLSCKKKQKKSKQLQQKSSTDSVCDGKVAKRKNRKRVKISQHVKEHLNSQA
jgi:U3 small nucleolar RNA-associated protein 23